ncbi:hypothetical protein D9M71_550710 [compost metagenome]
MAAGNPRPRRPPVRRALSAPAAGWKNRHRRVDQQGPGRVQGAVQSGAILSRRRFAVRSPVRPRRIVHDRQPQGDRPARARPYPGGHGLPGRQRCDSGGRHDVHARRRHRPLRFPGRQCQPDVCLDPQTAGLPRQRAAVRLPRLPAQWPRAPVHDHRR